MGGSDQTIISMAIFRHLPYYKHELGGDFKYFTIWSLGWIQVEIVVDETAVDRVWVICPVNHFQSFSEVKDLEKLITEESGGDSDTLSMAGEVLARQGKGWSFFLCSILSRPFFWRKISDLNRTLWDFGSGRTLFFAWTLDMDFFSEAVVDDECMDFFRGWWMDDVYLMIWCSHSYILGNLPEFWSVSFFLRNFNFLRLPRRPRNGLPVSKIGNWLHDSFFFKPVLSKFKFSMYTGQKNWHALNGALLSKFTGAKSSGMYRELMRLFLFLGKNLYYCEEASSESHFLLVTSSWAGPTATTHRNWLVFSSTMVNM